MVTIVLFLLSAVISSIASSSFCDITNDVQSESGQFYSLEHNNSCYVFALQPVTIQQAVKNCRALGGHLTDVEKQSGNILQNYIKQANGSVPNIDNNYWIGLLYNDDLSYLYWVNDAEVRQEFHYLGGRWVNWVNTLCVTMSHAQIDKRGCTEERPYICKLDLPCISPTNSTSCQRCWAIVQNKKVNLTPETNTSDDGRSRSNNDSNNSSNNDSNTTNSTANGVPTVQDNQKDKSGDNCKQLPRSVDTQTVVLVAVLGGVNAILIVTLGATCVIVFKYRRLMRSMQQSPRISLVDILKADKLATNTKRPSQQTGSHHGSATELLYSQADGASPDPSKVDRQAVTTSDIIYHNHGSFHGTGGRTHKSSPDAENNVYSHLNHSGESLDNSGSRQVYGIESASDFKEPSKEKSPTYEQYNY